MRDTCKGLYGESRLKRVGLSGKIPTRTVRLAKRGELVQSVLRAPDSGLEPVIEVPEGEATITPAQLARAN